MTFGGAILAKLLLQITQTPAELLAPSSVYLKVVFLGLSLKICTTIIIQQLAVYEARHKV